MDDNIHIGHRRRIKERYTQMGFSSLSEKDILELILTYAIPRKDVYSIADSLICEYGSLENVLNAHLKELTGKFGLSEHTSILIKLINDIRVNPLFPTAYRSEKLSNVKKAVEYCHRLLARCPNEIVLELFLDSDDSVTELVNVSSGSDNAALLPIESIVEHAVRRGVRRIIIAHNHPSGKSSPSTNDLTSTDRLIRSLNARNIELTEHIIVAKSECTALMHHQTITMDGSDSVFPWKEG